jgi:hypothetical protein
VTGAIGRGKLGREGLAGLPLRCHVVLPGLPAGANVAVCERGSHGVRITSIDLGGFSTARRLVRALNDTLGIDAAAEHAMLVGCLRGWNSEVAGPDFLRAEARGFMKVAWQAKGDSVLH